MVNGIKLIPQHKSQPLKVHTRNTPGLPLTHPNWSRSRLPSAHIQARLVRTFAKMDCSKSRVRQPSSQNPEYSLVYPEFKTLLVQLSQGLSKFDSNIIQNVKQPSSQETNKNTFLKFGPTHSPNLCCLYSNLSWDCFHLTSRHVRPKLQSV